MILRDLLSPFYVWKRAFEKPYSIATLSKGRPGAPNYRGFHKNDIDKCIGCGSCEEICQNQTIEMVPVKEAKDGDSGLRPKMDYGRCCWCALCVDICPSGSLTMSNAYTWVEPGLDLDVRDTFCYIPGAEPKPWDEEELGYHKPDGYELLNLDRTPMSHIAPDVRLKSFVEMVHGYSREMALTEADRCIQCGICTATCPAHMDIPGYIKAIRENDIELGLKILYDTNPLPGVCGRICTRKCEDVCALSHRGDAISIRWLKRYLSDSIEAEKYKDILRQEITPTGKKVAIIGAGPGGLSAAYYLSLLGHSVEIFEQNHHAGGMLRYGIPEYRLPYDSLDKDINYILSLGVKLNTNTRIGKDISFDELYPKYDAVFISVGQFEPYRIGITGDDLPSVISGLSVLEDVTKGNTPDLGKQVLVIGGGNVAMDAARTSRRLGCDVTVIYRRRLEDMPADREEIDEAMEEGVNFIFQAIPLEIITHTVEQHTDAAQTVGQSPPADKEENYIDSRLRGNDRNAGKVDFIWGKAEMVPQTDGSRPQPVHIEGSREVSVADTVIAAIGQGTNFQWMDGEAQAKIELKKYRVVADRWGRTTDNKIFVGGDMFNRTADAITAIADGHRSAKAIDKLLQDLHD